MKMSGECYTMTEKSSSSKESLPRGMKGDAQYERPPGKITQLLEYETMVSSAESKCSELKGQLERMKQIYANQSELVKIASSAKDNASIKSATAKPMSTKINSFILETSPSRESNSKPQSKSFKMVRQNSKQIGTDTTGAALGTINNILAGITKSIQMPDFLDQIKDMSVKTNHQDPAPAPPVTRLPSKHSHRITRLPSKTRHQDSTFPVHGVEDVKINSKQRSASNVSSKTKFKPKRTTSKASSTILKKIKKSVINKFPVNMDKRTRISDSQIDRPPIPVMNRMSRKIIRKQRYLNRSHAFAQNSINQDLVEIYHNAAVKESKSSECDVPKKRPTGATMDDLGTISQSRPPVVQQHDEMVPRMVPPLDMVDNIEEKLELQQHRSLMSTAVSRNYEMPTISSRMKQVAKYYMNSFNIKTIPFCPATSTGPSHNIGINIQQVMSMVKTKQPVQKLSPTLAYNIGLAAGKWSSGDSPLSFLVSSMTSRVYSQCPLSKSMVNYQHLQEMAKTVPQETIEECDENEEVVSPTRSIIITGPSGDVKITNPKQTVWTVEGDDRKCTCLPHKGIEFQQIINKFNNGNVSKSFMSRPSATLHIKGNKLPKAISSDMLNLERNMTTPLQNKEKKLKEVLGKLHDEFESMTKTYDELTRRAEEGKANDEITDKLEALDKELNNKEEEIVMVMTLYKEVLALKDQVRTLKDKASKENVTMRSQMTPKVGGSIGNGYSNNSAAAGLLNKLLRQIQHFQTHYKK